MIYSAGTLTHKVYATCAHHHIDLADDFTLDDIYLQLIRAVWDRTIPPGSIHEPAILHAVKGYMAQVFQGYGGNFTRFAFDSPDFNKLASIEQHVYQFAGAKNYQELRDLTLALKDGTRILPFKEWDRKAMNIMEAYEGRWKQIEYNTAIRGAQQCSKWVGYAAHPRQLIKYLGSGEANECPICRPFNDIIRPASDPIWDTIAPTNHFGCHCSTQALNDGTPTPDRDLPTTYDTIPTMFRTNLAKTGIIFPPQHPYFIGIPPNIKAQINNLFEGTEPN